MAKIVKITAKQKENIQKKLPYKRFWQIGETESVGIKTYSALFTHFYDIANNGKQELVQTSLFE